MLSFLLGTHCVVEFKFVVAAGEVGQGGVKAACSWVSATSVQSTVRFLLCSEMSWGKRKDLTPAFLAKPNLPED